MFTSSECLCRNFGRIAYVAFVWGRLWSESLRGVCLGQALIWELTWCDFGAEFDLRAGMVVVWSESLPGIGLGKAFIWELPSVGFGQSLTWELTWRRFRAGCDLAQGRFQVVVHAVGAAVSRVAAFARARLETDTTASRARAIHRPCAVLTIHWVKQIVVFIFIHHWFVLLCHFI